MKPPLGRLVARVAALEDDLLQAQEHPRRPAHDAATRAKIGAANRGKVKSEETKAKIRAALTGRAKTEAHRRAIAAAARARWARQRGDDATGAKEAIPP